MKLGTTELLVILAIIVVLFGPSQLPKLAKMFGKSVKNVREGMKETDDDQTKADQAAAVTDQAPAAPSAAASTAADQTAQSNTTAQ